MDGVRTGLKKRALMNYELKPNTSAGAQLIAIVTSEISALREAAEQSDRTGEMPRARYEALQAKGCAAAFVPEELGGLGLTSVHDWLLGIAALARGDGSVAIALNMHLAVSRGMAQAYRAAIAQGQETRTSEATLRAIAKGEMLICATATERGTDNLHPFTEAVASVDGWVINGQKMFVTMSPIATHLGMNLRMRDDEGDYLATTLMPIDTPGLIPQNDWDALGMRGSGSQAVHFENVSLPRQAVRRLGPWGEWSPGVLINRTLGNLPLVAAFLGIAEHAYEISLDSVGRQKRVDRPLGTQSGVQNIIGEMTIELAKCRSMLTAACKQVDDVLDDWAGYTPDLDTAHNLMSDYQCAKAVINRGAIAIVNNALDVVGGAGYMSANVLSRLYRDVRAGPFMQPYSPAELPGYVGKVALGYPPVD